MCTYAVVEARPFLGVGFRLANSDVLAPLGIPNMDRWQCMSNAPTTSCACGEALCPHHAQHHVCVPELHLKEVTA